MRRFAALSCALLTSVTLTACSTSTSHEDWHRFGGNTDAHSLPQVALGAVGDAKGQVKVEGTISEVCAAKGCWMKVRGDDGAEVLVRFKDYAFFVPRNAAGRTMWATGTAETVELSVDALQHLAHDAGKSDAEVAAITKPAKQVTFMADAVWIQGPGLQDTYRPIGKESCEPLDSGSTPVKSEPAKNTK